MALLVACLRLFKTVKMPKNKKSICKVGNEDLDEGQDEQSSDETKECLHDGNIETVLAQLAGNMLHLQEVVDKLAQNSVKVPSVHEKTFLTNWRELGGGNLTYYPDSKVHPMYFLKKLNRLLSEAGVPEENKLNLAIGCLKGSAQDWVAVKESKFKTYGDFETAFKLRFWGVERQRDLYLKLCYGRHERGNRADYLMDLVGQAQYLDESVDESKLVDMLAKHFDFDIQRGIAIRGVETVDDMESYLRKIDATFMQTEQNSSRELRSGNDNRFRNARAEFSGEAGRAERRTEVGRQVNTITLFAENANELLSDNDEDEAREVAVPIIKVSLAGSFVEVLIDSGSEISAISEGCLRSIEAKGIKVPRLPVTGASIVMAVGSKPVKVRHQVLMPFNVNGYVLESILLVVPGLNTEIILGCDWLSGKKVRLDFRDDYMEFEADGKVTKVEFEFKVTSKDRLQVNNIRTGGDRENEVNSSISVSHKYSEEDFRKVVEDASSLSNEQKHRLYEILRQHESIFSECPGRVKGYEHEIRMVDDKPFCVKAYPIPFAHRREVDRQVKEMLSWGIIEKGNTEYLSPLVTVVKKDGSVRICLDARHLNLRMEKDLVIPPNPNELLMTFKANQVLTTLDLTSAYWQVPLREQDRKYVGFLHEGNIYRFKVVAFGLSTAMASLIRCLNSLLGPEVTEFAAIYVDDLLIHSDSIDEHLHHLNTIFKKMKEAGLTVKLRKCMFFREEVSFLGHVVSGKGVSMDPKRSQAIDQYPRPRNIRELRAFLGLVNYEQRFCKDYATLTVPLTRLLKKGVPWTWGVTEQDAFNRVKSAFVRATLVSHPDWEKRFYIEADSSGYGIGGCLYQVDTETKERRVVGFTSRTLRGGEVNYTVTEKEALAIIHCLRQWRTIILGRLLTIVTDHKALTFVLSCKLKSSRLTRWILFMQEFSFDIEYRKGAENVVPDVLSRRPMKVSSDTTCEPVMKREVSVALVKLTDEYRALKGHLNTIREDQRSDEFLGTKIVFLENCEREAKIFTDKEEKVVRWFIIHKGILFKRGDESSPQYKLCVPKGQIIGMVQAHHAEIGHFGKTKTYNSMKEKFYFPKMQKRIRKVVAACDLCQKSKPSKTNRGDLHSVVVEKPGQLVCLDLIGPLPKSRGGVTQLLVVVDAFSKYVRLYPLKRATTVSILNRILKDYVPQVQKPRRILSDNGTQFTSQKWVDTLEKEDIKVNRTSAYFPQGNLTERCNREVGRLLRAMCHEQHTRWAYLLQDVEQKLNNAIHDITGFTPNFLQFGKIEKLNVDKLVDFPQGNLSKSLTLDQVRVLAYERLRSKIEKRKQQHSQKYNAVTFQVGEKVLVKSHPQSSAEARTIKKFFLLFEGPFYIVRQAGPNSYVVADATGKEMGKHNIVNLKSYKTLDLDQCV